MKQNYVFHQFFDLFLKLSMKPVKHFSAHTKAIHVKIMKVTGQPYFEEKKDSSHLIIVFD